MVERMTPRGIVDFVKQCMRLAHVIACITWAGCGFPRPPDVGGDSGLSTSICTANQAVRCDGNDLVRCNGDGTAEAGESCSLGCSIIELRCNDVQPSNGLAPYLDMTGGEPDFNLGAMATINTDDGTFLVNGTSVAVKSATIAQAFAPIIRVFLVHSLTAGDVTVTGSNALAVVSNDDLKISGVFAASAINNFPGPGGFNDGTCRGTSGVILPGGPFGGAGGGGFGFSGGNGGTAISDNGTATGGAGGTSTGNPTLVPLRGGCDSGEVGTAKGSGGGAIQLVSRTKIAISGVVAANGSSVTGGGSGGGLLLEAPVVEVSGSVVANGGAGAGGCAFPPPGEYGRLDATPATGGLGCANGGNGGNGGAGNSGAGNGASVNVAGTGSSFAFAGYGGGGAGRIRVNTVSGGLHATGLFSPNPSTGAIATR